MEQCAKDLLIAAGLAAPCCGAKVARTYTDGNLYVCRACDAPVILGDHKHRQPDYCHVCWRCSTERYDRLNGAGAFKTFMERAKVSAGPEVNPFTKEALIARWRP